MTRLDDLADVLARIAAAQEEIAVGEYEQAIAILSDLETDILPSTFQARL
jgi:hypothetical protein